ncbi:MAG: hypothetical protein U0791_27395 [Gemmataceae bacterium]
MARFIVLAALLLGGCKEEAKTNPDLKVPDVPESGSSQGKGDMSKLKSKK